MAIFNQSVSSFLNAASARLGDLITREVSWRARAAENRNADLQWWSCALTVDPACRFYAGASSEVWDQLRHAGDSGFAVLVDAIERAAAERFGSEVRCESIESSDAPPEDLAGSVWEIDAGSIEFVMSTEVVEALGGEATSASSFAEASPDPVENFAESSPENPPENSMDMLLHVEIPVSVSLGRTRLRVKDLVGLGQGSVVELDQELGDRVEVRVNNCVIAHGEVVAVDGNYGVRILSMVSNGSGRRGLLSKEAV